MCRLLGYLGKSPIVLSKLLEAPKNSLIKQSKSSSGGAGVNADGVGVAWYDHSIDEKPGLYKSTQPAWNDFNLKNMIPKIKSHCFLGHLRAATIGDISIRNCHPFIHQQWSFMHNGSIRQFDRIRRTLLTQLSDEHFKIIHGYTDSEHFFALLASYFPEGGSCSVEQMAEAYCLAVKDIMIWQAALKDTNIISKLNTVLTDGHSLLATHYVTDPTQDTLSLFYAEGEIIAEALDLRLNKQESSFVVVASEPLCGSAKHWHAIPVNHMLCVDSTLSISVKPIV
jgi:glutamine amidotransferase